MQEVIINYMAVIVAAIVGMLLGGVWYGPFFGKQWAMLSGMTEEKMNAAKARGMAKLYILTFVGTFVMSWVLAHALVFASAYLGTSGVRAGIETAFWNWLGFIAPVTLGVVLWEGKPWKLWILNNTYYLLLLIIMGLILALWQ